MKRELIYSLLTALFWLLAFPPFPTGFFAYFTLIPLFLLLEDKNLRQAGKWGYITGLFVAIVSLYWIGWVTLVGMVGVLLFWPVYIAGYAVIHVFLVKRLNHIAYWFLPFIWVAIEYSQAYTDLAFPWNHLGYTQSYFTNLIQFAEYTGVYGVSFWVVLLNVMIWMALAKAKHLGGGLRWVATVVILLLLPWLHGRYVFRHPLPIKGELTVAVLQGNIDPFEKWQSGITERDFQIYERLTRKVAAIHPDLVVWPETAIPLYLRAEKSYQSRLHHLVDSLAVPILTGALDYKYTDGENYDYYNAAFLFEPNTAGFQTYHKTRLVPFSERVPFRDFFLFRKLKDLLVEWALGVGDYSRGNEYTIFSFLTKPDSLEVESSGGEQRIYCAAPICFESAFAQVNRAFVAKGAEMLVVITNDAWFGKTSGPHQHARFAVFRAIENRVPIARSANTGISCFVDAYGRTYQATRWYQQTFSVAKIQLYHGSSFYVRHGNLFAICVSIGAGVILLFACAVKGRN